MTKKSFTAGEAAPGPALGPMAPDVDQFASAGSRSLLAVAHLHARLMRNALEVNAEVLDFARRRVGEEIGASQKLGRARNPAEAAEVMSGFYRKALEDYAEAAERIVRITADSARRSIEETQAETDEVLARGSAGVALPE